MAKGGNDVKKEIAILLAVFALFMSFAGCDTMAPSNNEETLATESTVESIPAAPERQNVIKAWVGEFDEEILKNTIREYQEHGEPFVAVENSRMSCVTYDTGFEVARCGVVRLSKVDDTDMNVELTGYIDLFVETESNGTQIKIYTGLTNSSSLREYPLWSYLVRVTAVDGTKHYYYFRVDYEKVTAEMIG